MLIELDTEEVFQAFKPVAERCGYQFSGVCELNNLQYGETALLWELFKRDYEYVMTEYLTLDIGLHKSEFFNCYESKYVADSEEEYLKLKQDTFVRYHNELNELLSNIIGNWL